MKKLTKYSKEKIKEATKNARSFKEVILNLGLRAAGGNYKVIHYYCDLYSIDTSAIRLNQKEDKIKNAKTLAKKILLSNVLVENSTYSRTCLKRRLLEEKIKINICELCGQDENWHGKKISLILDHINGIYNDNRIENLRIVCPNCETTLDTHAGKKNKKPDVTCLDCDKKINRQSKRCIDCHFKYIKLKNINKGKSNDFIDIRKQPKLKKRKVVRPPYDELLKEVNKLGYCAVGRKYGVSDNAIRKWIKIYQKYNKIN